MLTCRVVVEIGLLMVEETDEEGKEKKLLILGTLKEN